MGEKFKEEYELDLFMETSAKTGYNAQELFIEAAKILYKDYNEYKKSKKHKDNENGNNDENSIGLSENGSKKKKKFIQYKENNNNKNKYLNNLNTFNNENYFRINNNIKNKNNEDKKYVKYSLNNALNFKSFEYYAINNISKRNNNIPQEKKTNNEINRNKEIIEVNNDIYNNTNLTKKSFGNLKGAPYLENLLTDNTKPVLINTSCIRKIN